MESTSEFKSGISGLTRILVLRLRGISYDALVVISHLANGEYGVTWQAHNPTATVFSKE